MIQKIRLCALIFSLSLIWAGCGAKETVPAAKDMVTEGDVKTDTEGDAKTYTERAAKTDTDGIKAQSEGMEPVYGKDIRDGTYSVKVDSSSSMFRITECQLTVKDGHMSAVLTMGGTGYLKLYMGTGQEAAKGSEKDYIPYVEKEDGTHTFQVPVKALDMEIHCSAFSRNKETWYDRVLVFRADSLPIDAFSGGMVTTAESLNLEDGTYTAEVTLKGGSGRSAVETPARLRVEDGKVLATIVWNSANYDYMKVEGEKYDPADTEGNSTFEIPVKGFDWGMPVIADTIAMSEPHEISYTLVFDSSTLEKAEWNERAVDHAMELLYADQFSVDFYQGGYAMITVKDTGRYLVVPETGVVPERLPEDVTVIRQPLKNMYLAATSAMDLICSLDSVDQVTLSGTDAAGWYVEEAKQAMKEGNMVYAGKYNTPDYELILSESCDLAIESTMIYHSPEVKEQLEKLGIPVLVERSSYESHPLGRMEWLKLYGVLLGKTELAETLFREQTEDLEDVMDHKPTGKTVAFFYISSNGYVNVRKSGDYVAKMIGLAGGAYVPMDLTENENALSTMNMQMEAFYAAARDADYMIYNSAIDAELTSLEDLLDKSSLLADFKAVKEGNVWCTQKSLFQETMGLGNMIRDIHKILTEKNPDPAEMNYMYRLR